jgi:hypothetical protein
MYKCFFCQHELRWESDFGAEEVYDNAEELEMSGRKVSYFTCPECGAQYEVVQPSFVPSDNIQN